MKNRSRRNLDLVALGALASRPKALMALVLRNPGPICDALGIERAKGTSDRKMRTLIRQYFARIEGAANDSETRRPFSELEGAIPGRLTAEEFANVLAGGTPKGRFR